MYPHRTRGSPRELAVSCIANRPAISALSCPTSSSASPTPAEVLRRSPTYVILYDILLRNEVTNDGSEVNSYPTFNTRICSAVATLDELDKLMNRVLCWVLTIISQLDALGREVVSSIRSTRSRQAPINRLPHDVLGPCVWHEHQSHPWGVWRGF
jgi:hypothetical protein